MSKIEDIEAFDEFEEVKNKKEEKNSSSTMMKMLPIIIILSTSIVLGITTYFICDYFINNQKPAQNEEFIGEQISLTDENVQVLYQYVSYGIGNTRIEKFLQNRSISLADFSDEEKMNCALQFVVGEDIEFTGELDNEERKIYTLPNNTIYEYMKRYFGPSVQYNVIESFQYTFTFQVNKMNVGTMKYNSARDGYDVVFASYEEKKEVGFEPFYGQLIGALRRPDGSIVLQERVVYTELRTDNGEYAVDIYKDPEKTILLETKTGITDENLTTITIDPSSYESTAIVEYLFGVYNMQCYFESSRIIL